MTPDLKQITVNGVDIAYQERGSGALTLLLLHGGFLSHAAWQHQLDPFGEHYRIIAPDMRGHGQSGRTTPPYRVEQFAVDMLALLDALHAETVVVVGHSFGGMVAQAIALTRPDRLCGLVLADTSYGTRAEPRAALLTDWLATPIINLTPIGMQAKMYARQLGGANPSVQTYVEREIAALADNPANYRALWGAVTAFDSFAQLANITTPTLVIIGDRSHSQRSHGHGRKMAEIIPNAQLEVVADAGHMLAWDDPAAFNAAVLGFVGAVCADA